MSDQIPFHDMAREAAHFRSACEAALVRVFDRGRFLFGPELEAFEEEIAAYHGVRYAIGVASGTDAVEIALRSVLETPREVSTTALTAVPTLNAIEAANLTPVLRDIDPRTFNAPGSDVHVHLYGLATDARSALVEDVAHSMGASWEGRRAGTMGRTAALSFYPSKILGAFGDGGAVLTNDAQVAAAAREVRHYGYNEAKSDVVRRGQNSRLSELQAAFLRAKLTEVESFIDARRRIAARYSSELSGHVAVPEEPSGSRHVFHCYVIQHPERDRLRAALSRAGVGTMLHYERAIHQYSRWSELGAGGTFTEAERAASTVLSLPCYPFLREDEQDRVIAAVKSFT